MAFLQCSFHSDVLGMASEMNVILPQKATSQIGMDSAAGDRALPVLYLLHGLSDDHTIWCRRTSIERYAAEYSLAIVMPNGHRSFYTDMDAGGQYFTFITEELPAIAASFFHLSTRREDTSIAGLSMGGYGALKAALSKPGQYGFAASLSGVADIASWRDGVALPRDEPFLAECRRVFGSLDDLPGSRHDLMHLASAVAASGAERPRLYQCCGTEDVLYDGNLILRDHLRSLDWDLHYDEGPGNHDWGYWDTQIREVLARVGAEA